MLHCQLRNWAFSGQRGGRDLVRCIAGKDHSGHKVWMNHEGKSESREHFSTSRGEIWWPGPGKDRKEERYKQVHGKCSGRCLVTAGPQEVRR